MPRDRELEIRIENYLHLNSRSTTADLASKLAAPKDVVFRSCVSLEGDGIIRQAQPDDAKEVLWEHLRKE